MNEKIRYEIKKKAVKKSKHLKILLTFADEQKITKENAWDGQSWKKLRNVQLNCIKNKIKRRKR